mmetsp:Transcript_36806/g.43976  ORF Transcript_36806/g.43976 Transcript_36806/m.43976 type:complete len:319 (+) Transcript_36806:69-1025(+)|eukprot:CAMPEP_0198261160 /NCGR_PEP_ID=MMETSP1447-20131203/9944_1 /TAXON_ID=420782 /ORGANISM="Chaetoceros dichaeta, Strain CCMP1751" /LENGTH=318 /DNA_ID=CAMNT_0043948993 /DNA_START=69 /DNA_END=1025 /DNA_ORIENTATION=-
MPSKVVAGVTVVSTPGLTITEYHGGASTNDSNLSAVHEVITSTTPTLNPWRCPEFTEYILMIEGEAHIEHNNNNNTNSDDKTPASTDDNDATTTTELIIVPAGSSIYLPAGCRVRVNYPSTAELIAICLPAYSPDTEHPEPTTTTTTTPAHATNTIPTLHKSIPVVIAPTLTITEYIGSVASSHPTISACLAHVNTSTSDAWQSPIFREWVLVLHGTLHLQHGNDDGMTTIVPAGSGVTLEEGERVKWVWPDEGGCVYVPICVPAFSPEGCRREEEVGSAKDEDPGTMVGLKELHATATATATGTATGTDADGGKSNA